MTLRKFKPVAEFVRESIHPGKGHHRIYRFPNGYGASVVDDGYGAEGGKFELALIEFEERGPKYKLAKHSPMFDDVHGWLTEEGVQELLLEISKLKKVV